MKPQIAILFILMICSCKVNQDAQKIKRSLSNREKNEYRDITNEIYTSIVDNDTISVTQIKYNYAYTEFLLQKVMFDNFGKWDQALYRTDERHPTLLWKDIQLFQNNNSKYTVATNGGGEDVGKIYSSVMILDENGKDLLLTDQELRNNVSAYFSKEIYNHDWNKDEFFSVYWKEVDPKFYKKYVQKN